MAYAIITKADGRNKNWLKIFSLFNVIHAIYSVKLIWEWG